MKLLFIFILIFIPSDNIVLKCLIENSDHVVRVERIEGGMSFETVSNLRKETIIYGKVTKEYKGHLKDSIIGINYHYEQSIFDTINNKIDSLIINQKDLVIFLKDKHSESKMGSKKINVYDITDTKYSVQIYNSELENKINYILKK